MKTANTISRLERLDELVGILRSRDTHKSMALAKELGVSTRTLLRDLAVLKDKGYPIETEQGRGGGVRLHRLWGVGRLQLNYQEVIDLLLSLAVMEKIGSPIFLGSVKAIRHKISISFPQEQRSQIEALRNRIIIGGLASDMILESLKETQAISATSLYEAFFDMKCLNIAYTDADDNETQRIIEPQYLFLHWPIWYVLAWDHLREDVRCFRLDRMCDATPQERAFSLKNRDIFVEGMESFISNL